MRAAAAARPGCVAPRACSLPPGRAPASFSALRRAAAPPLRAALDALCPLRGWADLEAIETRESPAHGRCDAAAASRSGVVAR